MAKKNGVRHNGIAKVTRPRPNKSYPRTRLFRQLDRCCRRPVVWIAGPPGAGKTTLVTGYLEARGCDGFWYQLDRGDSDIATFFHYLSRAVPDTAGQPRFSVERRMELEVFSRRFFEQLYDKFVPPFVAVFDNYHTIAPESELHDIFRWGLEEIPKDGCVVVISRTAPPNSLGRLESGRAVAHIGPDDLRLRLDEAKGIARLWRNWESGRRLVPALHRQSEGWTAGLVLMLEFGAPADAAGDVVARSRANRFRYFGGEILDRLDPPAREVLMKTAILPVLTPGLARALTGHAGAGRVLADRHERNHFIERLAQREPVYRYHALFREFLLDELEASYSPAVIADLRRTAVGLLEQAGWLEEAAGLCLEIADSDRLAELCHRLAPELLAQGRTDTLESWLRALPEAVRAEPWVKLRLGQVELPRAPGVALGLFEEAYAGLAEGDESNRLAAWCGVVDAVMYGWDDFRRLDTWIARVEKTGFGDADDAAPIHARAAGSMFGALMFRCPAHPRIGWWAQRSLSLARRCGDAGLLMRTVENQSHYYIWMGDLLRAGLLLEEANRLVANEPVPVIVTLGNIMLNAVHCWHTCEFEHAVALVEEGLGLGRRHGVTLLDTRLAAQGVYASIGMNDFAGADGYLEAMESVLDSGQRLDISHYYHLRGWVAQLRGDLDDAYRSAMRANELAEETGAPFPVAFSGLHLAYALYERGEHEQAVQRLAVSRRIGEGMESDILLCQCALITADFHFAAAEYTQCAAALREAFALARRRGYWNVPFWNPPMMGRLCAYALDSEIEPGFVRELVLRRRLEPDSRRRPGAAWPWPARIRALGGFTVEVDGSALEFERKARRKPLDLLRALVGLGGREVHEQRLADLLWPDAEGDTAQQSLATTVHRARRLLDRDDAILRSEGRLSLNPSCCWVDVAEFENGMAAATRAGGADKHRLLRAALRLYSGPFLEGGSDTAWSIAARERLEDLYVQGAVELAGELESRGDHDTAFRWYQQGVELARASEVLYRGLIRCAVAMGETSVAVRAYRRCERALQASLGVAPSAKTRQLLAGLEEWADDNNQPF